MKIYNIVGGVNGVGKSSLTGVLCSRISDMGEVIDPDSISVLHNCSNIKASRIAVEMIQNCIEDGISFTQETTLSSNQILNTIKCARIENYYIRMFYVGVDSLDESIIRIANRVRKGGHDIAKSVVEKRYAKRFEDLKKVIRFCDEIHFYDNDNGFKEVGEYKNRNFYFRNTEMPEWFESLVNFCCV